MERSVVVKVKKLNHFDSSLNLPTYESLQAAGADLRVSFPDKGSLTLAPGEKALLPTGLSLEIPEGFEIQVRPRSGLSFKTSLMVLNSPGTIDSDYRGELKVILGNLGNKEELISHGERIAQVVLAPVWKAEFKVCDVELSRTERGARGFGSTGHL
ncbi:MAG: dUTP diphosphatase [Halobacteriovoraceae bacterium]|nr:dUTP diphosphatase [Halobacteriovoraceae bacterium]